MSIEPRMIMACPGCGRFVKATENKCSKCNFDVQGHLCSDQETQRLILEGKRDDTR